MRGFSKYIRDFFTNRKAQLATKGMDKSPLKQYYTRGGGDTGIAGPLAGVGGFAVGSVAFKSDDDEETIRKKFKQLADAKTQNGEPKYPPLRSLQKQDPSLKNIKVSQIVDASKRESERLDQNKQPGFTDKEIESEIKAEQRGPKSTGAKGMEGKGDGLPSKAPIDKAYKSKLDRINRNAVSKADALQMQSAIMEKFRIIKSDDGKSLIAVSKTPNAQGEYQEAPAEVKKYLRTVENILGGKKNKDGQNNLPQTNVKNIGALTKSQKAAARRIARTLASQEGGGKEIEDRIYSKTAGQIAGMKERGLSEKEISQSLGRIAGRAKIEIDKQTQARFRNASPSTPTRSSTGDGTENLTVSRADSKGKIKTQSVSQQEQDYLDRERRLNEESMAVRQNEIKQLQEEKAQRDLDAARIKGVISGGQGKVTVSELRESARSQGLPVSGNKATLLKRLREKQNQERAVNEKDIDGTRPVKFDLKYLDDLLEFELKKETKREIIGSSAGATAGALAALKRHRDWLHWKEIEEDRGGKLKKPEASTRRKMNLALHGGSALRLLGGALAGYGLTKAYNMKKKKDELRSIQGRKG